MSPEQAEGKVVDARSDIFSFGAVLYEMVTGRRAFQRDSRSSTLLAIVKDQPASATGIKPDLPRDLETTLNRCLRKDPNRRFQHMGDVKIALEELKEQSDSGTLPFLGRANSAKPNPFALAAGLGAILLLSGLGAWMRFFHQAPDAVSPTMRAVPITSYRGAVDQPSFSPDGNQVAFDWTGEKEDNFDIYVKLIGPGPPIRLTTDAAIDFKSLPNAIDRPSGDQAGLMAVSGCSGGGVLSSWVIGHTDRFAAAAVRCPVIDWMSMTGNTDVPLFTYSFFQKPFWEDPSDWLSHSSVMTVGKVTTPTLLMTGVLDRRTPMPQTEEYFAALKVRGVAVKLLQFEGE
jgi:hypothetical protein